MQGGILELLIVAYILSPMPNCQNYPVVPNSTNPTTITAPLRVVERHNNGNRSITPEFQSNTASSATPSSTRVTASALAQTWGTNCSYSTFTHLSFCSGNKIAIHPTTTIVPAPIAAILQPTMLDSLPSSTPPSPSQHNQPTQLSWST